MVVHAHRPGLGEGDDAVEAGDGVAEEVGGHARHEGFNENSCGYGQYATIRTSVWLDGAKSSRNATAYRELATLNGNSLFNRS